MNLSSHVPKVQGINSYGQTWKQEEKKFKIRRSVEFSSATAICIPWRVDGHSHGETCRYKEGNIGCGPFPNLKLRVKKMWQGDRLQKTATGKPYASSKSDCQGGPKAYRAEWSHNLKESPVTIHHSEAAFSIVREIYGREHDDPMDDLDVKLAIWAYFWIPLFEQQFILDKTTRRIYDTWKNTFGQVWDSDSMEQCGTVIPWNWKNDQWTKRNHWYKDYRFQRCYVDLDKLVVWKGLSDHQLQNLRLFRLCAVCRKNGRWSYCDLEEENSIVFGKQSLQRYESNRRHADGVRVDNIPRNHDVGPPREDSMSNERLTVWTWALHIQDHLHVNVQRHWIGSKKETKKDVNTIQRQLGVMLADSLAVIGLSWVLDQKRSGTELPLTDLTDHGINQQRTWWQTHQDPGSDGAIHYSDIIDECRKKKFDDASQWLLEDWISTLAINSCTFDQSKVILEKMLLFFTLHVNGLCCHSV